MDYDRWLLNQADIHEQRNGKMGYRSNVCIELVGRPEDVAVVLNTYKLSESPQDIEASNHILETTKWKPEFYAHETENRVSLLWSFEDVKWYIESQNAYDRLADIVDEMNLDVALFIVRTGEDSTDIEQHSAGMTDDYEASVYAYSGINIEHTADCRKDFETYKIGGASA